MTTLNISRAPRYSEEMVKPLREEVTSAGVEEWRTAEAIDHALQQPGVTLVFINSVCGCAARSARPALKLALGHDKLPDRIGTCFAGVDLDAVESVRRRIKNYPASSPSIALFKDGEPIYFMPRHHIEGSPAEEIAEDLKEIFDVYCK
ncbi:BrxA/BrxB family bacilliredoxin [Calditrichota bacterium LG25]